MNRHILIIGGMGPQASVYAHQRLIELSRHQSANFSNEDYPRVTHLSINVKDFISNPAEKTAAKEYILQCIKGIDISTVDTAFIACNTAHILFEDLAPLLDGKLVSMIELTKQQLKEEKIGIVATPSTIQAGLYDTERARVPLITPDPASLDVIESVIRNVISGVSIEDLVPELQKEIDKLSARGATKIILGCSELSMFNKYLDPKVIIDPIDITINDAIRS